ncbi:MAG: LacI family DNA-binding transcriptional regulator, partial [Succinivibrio sp.]
MTVTVKDLAEASGVSRGTVDRVLHERGSVRPEVALRIRALAREMGYVPNRAGRALAGMRRRYTVGVLLPSIGNVFFDDVLEGISTATREFADMGVDVVIRK